MVLLGIPAVAAYPSAQHSMLKLERRTRALMGQVMADLGLRPPEVTALEVPLGCRRRLVPALLRPHEVIVEMVSVAEAMPAPSARKASLRVRLVSSGSVVVLWRR